MARYSRKVRNLARLDKLLHNLRGKIIRLATSKQLNRRTVKVQVADFACKAGNKSEKPAGWDRATLPNERCLQKKNAIVRIILSGRQSKSYPVSLFEFGTPE